MTETVTLKEHFTKQMDSFKSSTDQRFSDQDKAVQAALASAEKAVAAALAAAKEAVTKAETATEARLKLLNEFRKQSSDRDAAFVLRVEVDQTNKIYAEKIEKIDKRLTTIEGIKQGSTEMRVLIFTVIGIGIAIMTFIGFKG